MLFQEVDFMLSEIYIRTERMVGVCVHKTQEECEVTEMMLREIWSVLKE